MDYKTTLNLPKTDFPMKGDLPKREPEFLARWYAGDVYAALRSIEENGRCVRLADIFADASRRLREAA